MNSRIGWFLTFNGLLFATLALAARAEDAVTIQTLLFFIAPVAGGLAAVITFLGLLSGELARDEIKKYWETSGLGPAYPPLYSENSGSRMGRWTARSVPIILGLLWGIVLVTVLHEYTNLRPFS